MSATKASIKSLRLRARLYALIRGFFAQRDVLEVETPMLSAGGTTEPNIDSFSTTFSGHADAGARERWLRTSAEFPMKRLLAAGVGDCYELGRVFRDGEAGAQHNPEFSMLEWYRVDWDHRRLADEVVSLVADALALVGKCPRVVTTTYRDWFVEYVKVDPFTAAQQQLIVALGDVAVNATDLNRDDWLDLLVTHRIQPMLSRDQITVVFDWPSSQCALSKIRPGNPPLSERFELYVGRYELANGYHELTDADEQRKRFENDNRRRRTRGLREVPLDENLLAAMSAGLPQCAGVALGIERLLMVMLDADFIGDVLSFPFSTA